jgi:hypothetical protein
MLKSHGCRLAALLLLLFSAGGCLSGAIHTMAILEDPSIVNGVSVTAAKWDKHDGAAFVELKVENYSPREILIGQQEVVWSDANGVEKSAHCCGDCNALNAESPEPVRIAAGKSAYVLVPVPFEEEGPLLLELGPTLHWVQEDGSTQPFNHTLVVPLDRPKKITSPIWQTLKKVHFGVTVNSDAF